MTRPWLPVLFESWRASRANSVVFVLILLLNAFLLLGTVGLAGFNVESHSRLLASLDAAGAKIVTVSASGADGSPIPLTAFQRIANLSGLTWAVALGPVVDVNNVARAGGRVPLRTLVSSGAPIRFSGDASGGAYVSSTSARKLGLLGAYSVLDPLGLPVVGWFEALPPLDNLNTFALLPTSNDHATFERVICAVNDPASVTHIVEAIREVVGRSIADQTTIVSDKDLVVARLRVEAASLAQGKALVLLVLGASIVVVGFVTFAGTVAERKDFGRRRALGATRLQLCVLVVLSAAWPAIVGASIGALVGWGYLSAALGRVASWDYVAGVAVWAVLATAGGACLPAMIAANRDPLRVLRVP